MSINVALIAPFHPFHGGMSRLAQNIYKGLNRTNCKITCVNVGVKKEQSWRLFFLYFKILQIISQADIVHIISASGISLLVKDLPSLFMAKVFRKKTVLNFVGGSAINHSNKFRWYKRLPFVLADRVVVPTEIFKNGLIQNGISAHFSVIPHAVDIVPFMDETSEKENYLLFAAKSLVYYSGYDQLIDIFCYIQKRIPNVQLWVAGDGPLRSELEAFIKKNNISNIIFLGNISSEEMVKIFSKSSVFVHCTKYESFGIVLVEAMASKVPVVSFSVGGIPEVIEEGKTGFLIPFNKNIIFAEKVITLLNNKDLRNRIGLNAQACSIKYSIENISELWYSLYLNILM